LREKIAFSTSLAIGKKTIQGSGVRPSTGPLSREQKKVLLEEECGLVLREKTDFPRDPIREGKRDGIIMISRNRP